MSKIVLLLAICCLCLWEVQAQTTQATTATANRNTCEELSKICLRNQRVIGSTDDVSDTFNRNCRKSNRKWKNITRCQLERAACQLTLVKCSSLTCPHVARALRS